MTAGYECTLSPALRTLYHADARSKQQLELLAIAAVDAIEANRDVASSLQMPKLTGMRQMRQVDVTVLNGELVAKAFVTWIHEENRWHVFLEGRDERMIEEGIVDQDSN